MCPLATIAACVQAANEYLQVWESGTLQDDDKLKRALFKLDTFQQCWFESALPSEVTAELSGLLESHATRPECGGRR